MTVCLNEAKSSDCYSSLFDDFLSIDKLLINKETTTCIYSILVVSIYFT